MGYLEVWTNVEGALDEEIEVDGLDQILTSNRPTNCSTYSEWRNALELDAQRDRFSVDVYEVWHDHGDLFDSEGYEYDCHCVQYLTDHHPAYSFGPNA